MTETEEYKQLKQSLKWNEYDLQVIEDELQLSPFVIVSMNSLLKLETNDILSFLKNVKNPIIKDLYKTKWGEGLDGYEKLFLKYPHNKNIYQNLLN